MTKYKSIEIYQTDDGQTQIQVRLEQDTIGLHLKNIYKSGKLDESATTEESSVVRQEGNRKVRRKIKF